LEPYEKIYVKPSFLKTAHGEIACETCHGGDPTDPDWQTAHKGIIKDPTFPSPEKACGACHEDIVPVAQKSLHYTLAPFTQIIKTRATKNDTEILNRVMEAKDKHCGSCHASCGQCHVSRPNYVDGGFLAGHMFQKKPPMDIICASCHGGRVYAEFTGEDDRYPADVHYAKEEMTCMDCHKAAELHADATGITTRWDLPQRPNCKKCHADAVSEASKNRSHAIHRDKVACQVCHAVASKNCFGCHVGTDKKGLPYYKCEKTVMLYKIGVNPNSSKEMPYEYMVLRHPPVDPEIFDSYVKNGLADIDKLPTWKIAAPHNIQRITPQNKTCNDCHGKAGIFLQEKDLLDWEKEANSRVVVQVEKIPRILEETDLKQ
jgi:thiosulfate/3-mercaptopyruvate sulfurtransferase